MKEYLNLDVMEKIGVFFNKVNERSEYLYGYRNEYNDEGDIALAINVEYFHPHILYDDRMRYIMENIVLSNMSIDNIICNTIISHFYGARGIHHVLTRDSNPKTALIDFNKLYNDIEYENMIRKNISDAIKLEINVYGTTELRTSLYGAANTWVSNHKKRPRNADQINILLWVSSFIQRGITEKMSKVNSLQEMYNIISSIEGVGQYYGYHCSTSNSVNPKININHDERFCVPGPGAKITLDLLFKSDCKIPYSERVIWFRENYKKYIGEININKNEWNIFVNGNPIFKEQQNELKTYGCEVGLCQYGVYDRLSKNNNLINKRKVSRIGKEKMELFYNYSKIPDKQYYLF